MKRIHDKVLSGGHNFQHIKNWLNAIDKLILDQIPTEMLDKAIILKNYLLASLRKEILLHGDLHQDNIIMHEDKWFAIDLKGIIGAPEFEIAAFDFIPYECSSIYQISIGNR